MKFEYKINIDTIAGKIYDGEKWLLTLIIDRTRLSDILQIHDIEKNFNEKSEELQKVFFGFYNSHKDNLKPKFAYQLINGVFELKE
jgi:hypothetical protein